MTGTLVFDPLLPIWLIATLGALLGAGVVLALWRGLSGWALRGLAGAVILAALLGPVYQQEDRQPLSDIVLMLEDESASQDLGDRRAQTATTAETLATRLAERPNTEIRRIAIPDGDDNSGTRAMTALSEALASEPQGRVAGIFLLSDGRVHDLDRAPSLPAPLHLLQSGEANDWDRRLILQNAPAFAILDEEVTMTLRIEDMGAAPTPPGTQADLAIAVDGAEPQNFTIPIGEDIDLPITLSHGGRNVLEFSTPEMPGELTDRNNRALVQINGVRDRLSVLLVSGAPHPGGRTWRNLLKSDSSVDLVHFTILRPPEKQDGVPVRELSLIAFPTRELFLEKIDDFDLIIFDRYKRRGILPAIYLENVRNYIEDGGAVLIAAGPDFASADSLFRSPLETIVPARPTARVVGQPFLPKVTDLGARHPVTAGLEREHDGQWGHWLRQVEITGETGDVVMTGAEDRALLVLDRVGQGRVALLASDHAWLWNRGYEGGGPQLELLRRLAHWMMKEPELEEEALWAEASGQTMRIIRRSLEADVPPLTLTTPSGATHELTLKEVSPGRFEAQFDGPVIGLYRLENGDLDAVIGLGPAAPVEFERTIASNAELGPLIDSLQGGTAPMADGLPRLRDVREGRPAAGRGWLGLTPRDAYQTLSVTQTPLLPHWLVLALFAALMLMGWLREGRR
ncbi:hypothetical protein ACM25N_14420 [Roseovarius sp. C7]|uniref:hypothetical protein n=1 Tax=Roseovarius sp. C7 TaxID=3398643 RepID=UPI0039F66491